MAFRLQFYTPGSVSGMKTLRLPLRKSYFVTACLLGACAGLGAFTFWYGQGLSYFSTDPKGCVNCHIMNDEYNSWQKSSHHGVAKCVDCHLPHETIPKYLAKADNGFWHSYGFTFQNFHEPIQIKPRNAKILQENCLACHKEFVHEIIAGSKTEADAVKCVHCHADVGHGARR
jgi:cytochrome c nitrite reductase small subunit